MNRVIPFFHESTNEETQFLCSILLNARKWNKSHGEKTLKAKEGKKGKTEHKEGDGECCMHPPSPTILLPYSTIQADI